MNKIHSYTDYEVERSIELISLYYQTLLDRKTVITGEEMFAIAQYECINVIERQISCIESITYDRFRGIS